MNLNDRINEAKAKQQEALIPNEINSIPEYLGEIIELNEKLNIELLLEKSRLVNAEYILVLDLTNENHEKGILMLFDKNQNFIYEHQDWFIMANEVTRITGLYINNIEHFVYGDNENKFWHWKKCKFIPCKTAQKKLF